MSSNSHNIPHDPVNMALTAQTQTLKAKEKLKVVTFSLFLQPLSLRAHHI